MRAKLALIGLVLPKGKALAASKVELYAKRRTPQHPVVMPIRADAVSDSI
jgi:hypothetical protein